MIARRPFLLHATRAAAGAAFLARPRRGACAPGAGTPRIDEPFHGAVLNRRHGREQDGGLEIRVAGSAPAGDRITVNGVAAARTGDRFACDIVLRAKENTIVAVAEGVHGRREAQVRVVWDRHSRPRYRFAIDDNSFFLRDIARKQPTSLFDCFYLDALRRIHRQHGARFVLNIYYTTDDGFDLTQFPDRYRSEWADNTDWLRLAFHAQANDPPRPYQDADPSQLIADLDRVAEQILRFAGERTYTPPTVIHFAMLRLEALRPLAARGVRVLSGLFRTSNGHWDINYRLDDARSEYLSRHDALMDFDSGIVFSKVDIVCNATPIDRIAPTLEPLTHNPADAEVMDLFTHEQYFWPFYRNYIPDHAERVEAAVRFVAERGYEPVFFHEGFLGGKDWSA